VSAVHRLGVERGAARAWLHLRAIGTSPAAEIFLWSRAALWLVAILAFAWFEPHAPARWDSPLLHDLGFGADVWARWDSDWYLRIAEHGYGSRTGDAAFYPLYPALVGGLGRVLLGHYVLAGIVVSLAGCLAAFVLLHRLARRRLGDAGALRAVLYLAVFPTALFLQAVYPESLYLALALAAFALAERGRFLPAALVAGLALLTRPVGVALLPALALLAWRSPEPRRNLAALAAAPALFLVYPLVLAWRTGDFFAFAGSQAQWHRHVSPAGPFGGLWDGLRAGWAGVRQLVAGADGPVYWPLEGARPLHVAAVNLECLAFLAVFCWLAWLAWTRLGAAYGLFAAASLAIPLSVPSDRFPLLSLPRFGLVVFPFFLALALAGARPRAHAAIVSVSGVLLGVALVQWVLWQWVA
jgi:hypothetical protein